MEHGLDDTARPTGTPTGRDLHTEGRRAILVTTRGQRLPISIWASALVAADDDGELRHLLFHDATDTIDATPAPDQTMTTTQPPTPPQPHPPNRKRHPVPTNAPAVELTTAVLPLLPAVNTVTAAHQPNIRSSNPCHHCTPTSHAECPHLWLAAAALDLIIHSLRLTGRDESAERKTYAGTTSPPPTSGTCGVR